MKKFGKMTGKALIFCAVMMFLCLPTGSYRSQSVDNERKGKWKSDR